MPARAAAVTRGAVSLRALAEGILLQRNVRSGHSGTARRVSRRGLQVQRVHIAISKSGPDDEKWAADALARYHRRATQDTGGAVGAEARAQPRSAAHGQGGGDKKSAVSLWRCVLCAFCARYRCGRV